MLIVFPLTYAPSHLVLPFLRTLPVPVLLLNSQSLGDFGAEATARAFIDNQAPTGLFDLSNALTRSSIPFRVASGHYRDPRLLEDLRDWCRAAQAAAAARRFRVGLAGHAMDGMGDLAVDHTALLDQLGAEVLHVSVAEISSRAESAPAEEVRRLMEEDRSRFAVDAELRPQEHEASSRLEHALRAVAAEHRLDALTFHFEALLADGRIRTIPVLAACKLLAEGIGYAGEGDVTCAALVAMMGRLAGPAEFFETWGIDFAGEAVMKNHMGEGNFLLAREDLPVRLTRSPVGLGEAMAPAATSFVLKPGEATLVNLATGRGGRLKLTVAEGSVPEMRPIAGVQTPHGKFTPGIPVRDFLERYAMAGASHHSALVYGRRAGLVERLAWILGLEMQVI
jgi:L-arabinose isomerase